MPFEWSRPENSRLRSGLRIALAGDDDDRICFLQTRQVIVVIQILQIHIRIIKIDIVVVITLVEIIVNVVAAAHRDRAAKIVASV